MICVKTGRFSSCRRAKDWHQGPLGSARAQPCPGGVMEIDGIMSFKSTLKMAVVFCVNQVLEWNFVHLSISTKG